MQRALIHHIHRELLAARAQGHGLAEDGRKGQLRGIAHRARSVVHGAQKHSREGKGHVVFRFGIGAPLTPFHPADTFRANQIGPCAGHTRGLLCAVEIHQHLAFCGFAADFVIVIDQELIVALHEINLDAFDTPLFVLIESGDKLIVQRFPNQPQDNSNIFLLPVSGQLRDVQIGNHFQCIAQLVPALIENNVGNPVLGREVNVILVSLCIDTGFEVNPVDVVCVPPIPGDLAGLDPGGVLQLRRLLQQIDDLVGEQVAIFLGNTDDAPWKRARA